MWAAIVIGATAFSGASRAGLSRVAAPRSTGPVMMVDEPWNADIKGSATPGIAELRCVSPAAHSLVS